MLFPGSRLAAERAMAVDRVSDAIHVPHQVFVSLAQNGVVGPFDDRGVKIVVELEVSTMIAFLQGDLHMLSRLAEFFQHLG